METMEDIPSSGSWPIDPQEDQPISPGRLWVDGCFDFVHHGHAGAMLQAKQLGSELLVGIHSDEAILHNKGPTVMKLDERIAAVDACRWSDKAVPHAPYVTSLPWVTHYGCKFVVHGDDITTDSEGKDTYRYVKEAGRFLEVKRTPGISTTDLVGRMLLFSKAHFIKDIMVSLDNQDGIAAKNGNGEQETGKQMLTRLSQYATDHTGKKPWVELYCYRDTVQSAREAIKTLVSGVKPLPGQRIVYVDGSFDIFSSGHIEFLKQVVATETTQAQATGWYNDTAKQQRIHETGYDYSPVYVVAGLHSDLTVNAEKGANYPIMNLYERALCALQCKYINALILNAPWSPNEAYLSSLPGGLPSALYHGPTDVLEGGNGDPYAAAKQLGIYTRVPTHRYAHVNAAQVVQRIMENRAMYEERQRKKGWKAEKEKELLRAEKEAVKTVGTAGA